MRTIKNTQALMPLFIVFLLIGGVGYLIIGDFDQQKETTVDIWYVEEITDPYTESGTVIQVTYRDRFFGDKVLILEKSDLSSGLSKGKFHLTLDTKDKLWKKTKPWTLVDAVRLS